uniref:Uncharacterized protein n=1 Tax=Rhizophora mucronata TaxID=61149 RepID=A0A2P2N4W9_RHIMU
MFFRHIKNEAKITDD